MTQTYICAYTATCEDCGVVDKPLGYTNAATGDFIQKCRSCGNEWIALTADEQEANAKARMDEAANVIDPTLRAFLKSRNVGKK